MQVDTGLTIQERAVILNQVCQVLYSLLICKFWVAGMYIFMHTYNDMRYQGSSSICAGKAFLMPKRTASPTEKACNGPCKM